jgi:hypothetical protein
MARISHINTSSDELKNPSTKYLEWKSNNKSFEYYDKSASKKVEVQFPLKFAFLQHYHNVKGFHDSSQGGIWSNEVFYIGSEPMTVRAFKVKGSPIASGLYKDIKGQVNAAGGRYHRSVYAVDANGKIINFQFKGSVVSAWSDFFDNNKSSLENNWITIKSFQTLKKGMVTYTVPVFEIGDKIDGDVSIQVDEAASEFQDYIDVYFSSKSETIENDYSVDVDATDSDLY